LCNAHWKVSRAWVKTCKVKGRSILFTDTEGRKAIGTSIHCKDAAIIAAHQQSILGSQWVPGTLFSRNTTEGSSRVGVSKSDTSI